MGCSTPHKYDDNNELLKYISLILKITSALLFVVVLIQWRSQQTTGSGDAALLAPSLLSSHLTSNNTNMIVDSNMLNDMSFE